MQFCDVCAPSSCARLAQESLGCAFLWLLTPSRERLGGDFNSGDTVGASPAPPSAEFPFQMPGAAHPPRIPRSSRAPRAAPPLSAVLDRSGSHRQSTGAVGELEERERKSEAS